MKISHEKGDAEEVAERVTEGEGHESPFFDFISWLSFWVDEVAGPLWREKQHEFGSADADMGEGVEKHTHTQRK